MNTYKIGARNITIPQDQSLTFDMGLESPWKYVTVEAETEEEAIDLSKAEDKLPTQLYTGHYVSVCK